MTCLGYSWIGPLIEDTREESQLGIIQKQISDSRTGIYYKFYPKVRSRYPLFEGDHGESEYSSFNPRKGETEKRKA